MYINQNSFVSQTIKFIFLFKKKVLQHYKMANNNNLVPGIELVTKTTAFARRIQTYILKNLRHVDLPSFFEEAQQLFIEKTQEILRFLNFH